MGTRKFTVRLWILALVMLFSLLINSPAVHASDLPAVNPQSASTDPVEIVFFWGDGCPHCATAKPYLEELIQKYDGLVLRSFEIYNSQPNQELFKKVAAAHGFEPRAVPTILIGDQHWEGWNELLETEIEAAVAACVDRGCPAAGKGLLPASGESADPNQARQSSIFPVVGGILGVAGMAALIYFAAIRPNQTQKRKIAARRKPRSR